MADYAIFTDAAADLPAEWYRRYGIRDVPMDYTLSGETNTFFPEREGTEPFADTQVLLTPLSPFIGAHTGPDMLSVCFWGKAR